ncbi:hypothetical protein [Phyllobacterium phragmitis]
MSATASSTNHFDASRMPFTANRQFKHTALKSSTGQLSGALADRFQQD